MTARALLAWLASFRLRILLRTAFLLLALTVLAMTVTVLQEEKQRSYDNYRHSLDKTREQILARLHHPAGQLALLNPGWNLAAAARGRPVVLPYAALDFDDQSKVRSAIEMSGCLVHYPGDASLCVAIGNNPWAGGFIYAAGTFASGLLQAHRIGDEFLDTAHRLRVRVSLRGQSWQWLAPFEALPAAANGRNEGLRGRFTGYAELPGRDYTPVPARCASSVAGCGRAGRAQTLKMPTATAARKKPFSRCACPLRRCAKPCSSRPGRCGRRPIWISSRCASRPCHPATGPRCSTASAPMAWLPLRWTSWLVCCCPAKVW